MFILDILLFISAAIVGLFSLPPLKESSEYRFQKKGPLFEGLVFLGVSLFSILFGSWLVLLIGSPLAFFIRKKRSETKLLDH